MTRRYLMEFSSEKIKKEKTDFLVIGSGIAGLLAALRLAESGQTILLSKKDLLETNTVHAQGGIAVAIGTDDSPKLHREDTLMAGAGHCSEEAVRVLVEEGPAGIEKLISLGVNFDRCDNKLALTREGAHSRRRILHAEGDASGKEIMRALSVKVKNNPRIKILENSLVVDLLTQKNSCYGVLALVDGEQRIFLAQATVLATGGIGQLYEITTNSSIATGDGMAMAYRAGAQLADMEFVQFHPTAFSYPDAPHDLISEAVRGEGAYLRDINGYRFMSDYHHLLELAPRDIVSRSIIAQMKKTKSDHVYLDLRHLDKSLIENRFPNIKKRCAKYGIDILQEQIPVAPAAHYMMGGIKTNISGKTNIKRLYACGEAACTGIHGANRLASNSLLEGLVFGIRVAESAEKILEEEYTDELKNISFSSDFAEKTCVSFKKERKLLQRTMTEKVGIIRSFTSLEEAKEIWRMLSEKIYPYQVLYEEQIEIANMLLCAQLITEGALLREESRGGHYRADFPQRNDEKWGKDIIFQK